MRLSKGVHVYRVLSELEDHFCGLDEAVAFCNKCEMVYPTVPLHAAVVEDKTTKRICVCETVEDCLTAIGLVGVFRRCLSAVDDLPSYALQGREAYPIIIQDFIVKPEDIVYPNEEQVHDAKYTNELWLLEPATPVSTTLHWLDMYSLDAEEFTDKHGNITETSVVGNLRCTKIKQLLSTSEFHFGDYEHPWITGRGHKLNSSEPEERYD